MAFLFNGGITIVIAVSTLVMLAWVFQWGPVVQVNADWAPMQFNTALCIFILSMSIFTLNKEKRRMALVFAGLSFLISGFTLLEWGGGWDFRIDTIIADPFIQTKTVSPGRMSINSALSFFILSSGILMRFFGRDFINFQTFLYSIVAGIGMVSFVSYFTTFDDMYSWSGFTQMAIHTSLCILLLSMALIIHEWRKKRDNWGSIAMEREPWFLSLLMGLTVCLVLLDLHLSDAVFIAPIYSLVLILSGFFSHSERFVFQVGIATLMVMLVVLLFKSEMDFSRVILFNRMMGFAIVGAFTYLQYRSTRSRNELHRLNLNLDEKVRLRTEELERQNKELQQFTYVASHDLQEPLRSVLTLVDFIETKGYVSDQSKAKEAFGYVKDASKRMSLLIKDLMDYSRLGAKKAKKELDVATLLDEVEVDLGELLKSSNTKIQCGSLPKVKAYPTELRLLFQNLMTNAVKFAKTGEPPCIQIDCSETQDHWKFSFKDQGIGIDEQYQDRIFVIFKRLHSQQNYPGTGIGLAHCKKIVELHGGRIWVESVKNEGATFYFTLSKNLYE